MSEMEKLLLEIVREIVMLQYPHGIINMEANSQAIKECAEVEVVLKRRLLPLLEAGADMRYQEYGSKVPMTHGPARDWDEALAAARRGGPDV